ncbi:uncharacterized protein PSFLO_07544 [Pseudozyma flocculosa]|uniref:Uncharacterized protein n=1 Tax=Pseudozyma flocculosa TaxID=84751 RepID=A0A5C3FF02_9BASI|nr:uncharacterized protein PSFLO_07544 [Pseudozyma flocculosa]
MGTIKGGPPTQQPTAAHVSQGQERSATGRGQRRLTWPKGLLGLAWARACSTSAAIDVERASERATAAVPSTTPPCLRHVPARTPMPLAVVTAITTTTTTITTTTVTHHTSHITVAVAHTHTDDDPPHT